MKRPKKAQMFVVTMVFMLGFLAIIQQALLMYGTFDVSAPPRESQYSMLSNIEEIIQDTVTTSDACGSGKNDLEDNFYEIVAYVRSNSIREGAIVSIDHSQVDCTAIGTQNPVIMINPIRITSSGSTTEKNYYINK